MVVGVKIVERRLKRMVNTSLRIERILKDSFSMGSGGRGRRKEKEKDTRMTESAHNVVAVLRQWRQKAC